jgi:RNA polymerase sigma-70 factor, ECF subfamily
MNCLPLPNALYNPEGLIFGMYKHSVLATHLFACNPMTEVTITSEEPNAELVLMQRVASGDARAYRQLVDQHLNRISGFAYRLLNDSSEAEDVAQETFERLWRHAHSWEPRAKLSTWLHRVAHNLCIDRLRKKREKLVEEMPQSPDSSRVPAKLLENSQLAHAVNQALATLPERQQTAITLVHHQGLSNIEAAEIMELNIDALESLLARGRRNLRTKLEHLRPELLGGSLCPNIHTVLPLL